jgi:hypothetical protein
MHINFKYARSRFTHAALWPYHQAFRSVGKGLGNTRAAAGLQGSIVFDTWLIR